MATLAGPSMYTRNFRAKLPLDNRRALEMRLALPCEVVYGHSRGPFLIYFGLPLQVAYDHSRGTLKMQMALQCQVAYGHSKNAFNIRQGLCRSPMATAKVL